ncbi:MAG: hypothetical protein D6723_02170 [Acidobacteria bacterium]|nr:MAG: hypothetical protein D6723_02170 [Acidobacteriota bacterium]
MNRRGSLITSSGPASRGGDSTLWRLENGRGVPDSATLARLAEWLSIPLERLVDVTRPERRKVIVHYEDENTPDIVEAHLCADRRPSPETVEALAELFRVAYNQFPPKEGVSSSALSSGRAPAGVGRGPDTRAR